MDADSARLIRTEWLDNQRELARLLALHDMHDRQLRNAISTKVPKLQAKARELLPGYIEARDVPERER
jgi:hypothetical protein